jgi:hypothetical protein
MVGLVAMVGALPRPDEKITSSADQQNCKMMIETVKSALRMVDGMSYFLGSRRD